MSAPPSPLILLFPGAFGTPAGFNYLTPHLHAAGLSTRGVSYPSSDPADPTLTTCANDMSHVRDTVLLPLLAEGKDVVILAHSYGGVVAGGAAKGLDKPSRTAQGLAGGVLGLIYVAGNITLEGESLLEAVGGAYPGFIQYDKPRKGLALIAPAMDVLYNDVDKSRDAELAGFMTPHATLAIETPAPAPAWADAGFEGRRSYVRTLDDACNPSFLQDAWMEKSKVTWDVVDFKTGHMPFVSVPEELARHAVATVERFAAMGDGGAA